MSEPRSVLYLDPYHTASHAALALALRDHSRHRVSLMTLPPRKWKWRMRGAALAFEPALLEVPSPPDVLVGTDYLNLSELIALMRRRWPVLLKAVVVFHENQLTYPAASSDVRDFHFGLVNLYSALAADRVVFNSGFHREEFLGAVEELARRMPDFRPRGIAGRIRERSSVIGLPLDLAGMDAARTDDKRPWVLWNHRWEEDRNPAGFFEAMEALDAMAAAGRAPDFRLVVAGQASGTRPAVFDRARERLARRIERWGPIASRREYLETVARCRAVVSTSRHEFFGLSVREAIWLGCVPVLPRRLVYPEIALDDPAFLYDDPSEIAPKVAAALASDPPPGLAAVVEGIRRFDLPRVVGEWDQILEEA